MIEGLKIENLRSIEDSGYIKSKPLTILVGKNSCGKSTYARTFPLLRQSVEERTRSAVLWFGRYVDFGSFEDAVKSGKDEITFTFKVRVNENTNYFIEDYFSIFLEDGLSFLDSGTIECSVTISQVSEKKRHSQFIKAIKIKAFLNDIQISASPSGGISSFNVNGNELQEDNSDDFRSFLSGGAIIPSPRFFKKQKRKIGADDKRVSVLIPEMKFETKLFSKIKELAHKNTLKKNIEELVSGLGIGNDKSIKKQLSSSMIMGKLFKNRIDAMPIDSEEFKNIRNLIYSVRINEIIKFIDNEVKNHFLGVRYIEPLRATAERYYRVQDLAVDEIDPRGSNIAMYIKNLSSFELHRFNEWCENALNFKVDYDDNPGHMALKIVEEGFDRNITDMGFGYSQLLPIAMHLWSSCINKLPTNKPFNERKKSFRTIVIEQPELHLHPAFQAKIADIFGSVASDSKNNNSNIIVETHSSHLINRLGEIVSEGGLNPDDVQIILFERDAKSDTTKIRTTTFDRDGFLLDWPAGFLQPEVRS